VCHDFENENLLATVQNARDQPILIPADVEHNARSQMLALAKLDFTSAHECQATVLLLTCVYQARSDPSASFRSFQNRLSRALEMTRILPTPFWGRRHRSSQIANCQCGIFL
jgi:hypothetical protein